MKKILILLALLATQSLYAQHWTKETESGDELLGTSDRVKFKYVDSINVQAFAFYSDGDYWKIGIGRDVFQPDKRGTLIRKKLNHATYALIGFYDEYNQLLEKWENCLLQLTQGLRVAETAKNIWGKTTKGTREVVPYLKNHKGYVRIVVPVVRGKDFDIKIPCLNNE